MPNLEQRAASTNKEKEKEGSTLYGENHTNLFPVLRGILHLKEVYPPLRQTHQAQFL